MKIEGKLAPYAARLIAVAGGYVPSDRPVTTEVIQGLAVENEEVGSCVANLDTESREKVFSYAVYKFMLANHAASLAVKARKYLDAESQIAVGDLERIVNENDDVRTIVNDLNERDRKKVFRFVVSKWLQSQEVISEVQEAISDALTRENVKSDTDQTSDPNQDTKV